MYFELYEQHQLVNQIYNNFFFLIRDIYIVTFGTIFIQIKYIY